MAHVYRPEDLSKLCSAILVAGGADPSDASIVADNLVTANMRGIDSHGVIRLPIYAKRIEAGLIAKKTAPSIETETLGTAVVNANNGWGAVVSVYAMDLAIEKAKKTGISAVAVKRSNHYGIAAYYGMRALKHNMVGISMTNANSNVAPWGSRKAYFGTNPICICIPAGEERPVVYDGATSVVAKGKIVLAEKKGESIPPTWAADSAGRPTTDATAAVNGVLLPFGAYKGSAFALAVDVLCGVLPGAGFGFLVGELYAQKGLQDVGHYFQAIDVSAFMPVDEFKRRMDQMIQEVRALPTAEGTERILLPGEIEFEMEKHTKEHGIKVVPEVMKDIKDYATKYGVEMPDPVA